MKINKDNYPSFFIDYIEGTISKSDLDELYAFVYQDPKLIQEFECLELYTIENDMNETFEEKQALKKIDFESDKINENNIELFVIAYFENDLNKSKKTELEHFLNNNKSYIHLFETYKKTILEPEIIEFENKEQLKHYVPNKIRPLYYYISAAASIALIFSMYFLMPDNSRNRYSANKSNGNSKMSNNDIFEITNNDTLISQTKSTYIKNSSNREFAVNSDKSKQKHKIERMTSISANLNPEKQNIVVMEKIELAEPVYTKVYASKNEPVAMAYSNNNYSTVSEYLVGKVNNYLGTDIPKNTKTKEKVRFWDIAEWGSKAVNKIFDKNTEVSHKYDENGNLSYLSFRIGKFGLVKNN